MSELFGYFWFELSQRLTTGQIYIHMCTGPFNGCMMTNRKVIFKLIISLIYSMFKQKTYSLRYLAEAAAVTDRNTVIGQ